MIKELLYKWLGLEPFPCPTCEVLRLQLDESNRERKQLLQQLLDRDKPQLPVETKEEEPQPIRPLFTPWRVRQQILEAEDKKAAQLLADKAKEIAELEKELEIKNG